MNRYALSILLAAAAAALVLPNLLAAQGETRGTLLSPHVPCREAPSRTASVVSVLRQTGDAAWVPVSVRDSAVDSAGTTWLSVRRTPSVPQWCWVPEALVGTSRGQESLLAMADRLLSSSEGRPLEDWVAVYNYFGQRNYREEVDASARLSLRRLEVLMRALEAAQIGRPWDPDPRVEAWLESLGPDVEVVEGRWVVSPTALDSLYEAPPELRASSQPSGRLQPARSGEAGNLVGGGESGPPPEARELTTIAPGVPCRIEPSRTVRTDAVLGLDEHFTTERPDTISAGEPWVSVRRWGGCWVPRTETAPADTHDHVLAIADRFLTSGEGRTLDYSLRVYNVLGSRHLGHRNVVNGSAILSLRRLQVLGEVLKTMQVGSVDGLMRRWVEQLADDVFYSFGAWYVRDEAFQRVYEAHRQSPEAEDILWELATGPSPHDCEGEFACAARVEVLEKFARYWTDYPRGTYVGQAVDLAAASLGGFLQTCDAARGAEPDSREARWWEWTYWDPSGAEVAAELRATLADVPPPDAEPLTTLLDRLKACATEVGGGSVQRRRSTNT